MFITLNNQIYIYSQSGFGDFEEVRDDDNFVELVQIKNNDNFADFEQVKDDGQLAVFG